MKRVVLTGATGMVGGHLLDFCLESDEIREVVTIGRRKTGKESDQLKEYVIADFTELTGDEEWLSGVDVVYFCMGVYTGAVSRDLFRKLTVEYPVALGKAILKKSPQAVFCLLSGAGADRTEKSKMMFAKDKGVAENQLSGLGFKSFHSLRPGYIYPTVPRKEPNFSYSIFRKMYPLFKMMGRKYSITSEQLAEGMFHVGIHGHPSEVLENDTILDVVNEIS